MLDVVFHLSPCEDPSVYEQILHAADVQLKYDYCHICLSRSETRIKSLRLQHHQGGTEPPFEASHTPSSSHCKLSRSWKYCMFSEFAPEELPQIRFKLSKIVSWSLQNNFPSWCRNHLFHSTSIYLDWLQRARWHLSRYKGGPIRGGGCWWSMAVRFFSGNLSKLLN